MLSHNTLLTAQSSGGGGGGGGSVTYYGPSSSVTNVNPLKSPNVVNVYYRRSILAWCYTSSELSGWGLSSNDVISKLRWYVTNVPSANRMPFPNYAIRMNHMSNAATNTKPAGSVGTNITTVKNQHSTYNANTLGTNVYHEMTLDTSFTWNGTDGIGFVFAWGQVPYTYEQAGQSRIINSGTLFYNWNDGAGTYTVSDAASTVNGQMAYRPAVDMGV